MLRIQYAAITDVGLQRNNNEDAYYASPSSGLWVVADGMGGHAAGEVASDIVIKSIAREIENGDALENAIQKSHHDILNAANSGIGGVGMGSTVVALKMQQNQYEICWVGDSRAYLLAPSLEDGKLALTQLTTDHSYVQLLYQSGAIKLEEIDTHPEKNIITQCLGSVELAEVNVDKVVGEWIPNSKILLCSDGLSDFVNDDQIKEILAANNNVSAAANALIQAALDGGGKDNITVAIISSPNALQRFFSQFFS